MKNPATILIVDDEPHNLAALRQILCDTYRLLFARSGAEALSVAIKHQPGLILLDIQMPEMDGFATCRALKAEPQTEAIPVIFVTSMSEVCDEAAGFAVGAVDYIVKPVSPAIVTARVRNHLSLVRASKLEQSYREAIYMLGEAGHYNDNDTGVHIWRMGAYARALAKGCGWSDEACQQIELAAPMHDTGKIGIAPSILRKSGQLTADEWEIMKKHPQIGFDILSKSNAPIFQLAAQIALCHHEKWDGSGYPAGLRGDEIPVVARIVALADVFDALSMRRSYKAPWDTEKILDYVQSNAGHHFAPDLVAVFFGILPQLLAIQKEWDSNTGQ